MEMIDWALWALLETAKYMILTYAILGFKPREGKGKYLVFLYVVAGAVMWYMNTDVLVYKTLWGFLLIGVFFKGRWVKKIQGFFLEYMLISAVDIVMWCVIVSVTDLSLESERHVISWAGNTLGMFGLGNDCARN